MKERAETFLKSQRPEQKAKSLIWLWYAATYQAIDVIKDFTLYFCSIV